MRDSGHLDGEKTIRFGIISDNQFRIKIWLQIVFDHIVYPKPSYLEIRLTVYPSQSFEVCIKLIGNYWKLCKFSHFQNHLFIFYVINIVNDRSLI